MRLIGKKGPSGLVVGYRSDVSELSGALSTCRGGLEEHLEKCPKVMGAILVASSGFLTTVFVSSPTFQMGFTPNLESPVKNERDDWILK